MKDWINKILGVKEIPKEPPPNATDDYVIVNRRHLEEMLSELNLFREKAAMKFKPDDQTDVR